MKNLLWLILIGLLFVACSSIDCPVQNSVNTVWLVYNDDEEPDTLKDTLSIFTTRRDGSDTVLVNCDTNVDSLKLPVSYNDPEDTLYFFIWGTHMTTDSVYYAVYSLDTVYIAKDNTPHFESVDCAISYFHTITDLRYTTNRIKRIDIQKTAVNYDASTEHFRIHFNEE